jgi:hypothetical protein
MFLLIKFTVTSKICYLLNILKVHRTFTIPTQNPSTLCHTLCHGDVVFLCGPIGSQQLCFYGTHGCHSSPISSLANGWFTNMIVIHITLYMWHVHYSIMCALACKWYTPCEHSLFQQMNFLPSTVTPSAALIVSSSSIIPSQLFWLVTFF